MSFVLPNGNLTMRDVNSYLQTNYGSYAGLSNANTPQAREMLRRLNEMQSLRNGINPGQNGALSSLQQAQVRAAAAGVTESRLAAQRSQISGNDTVQPNRTQTGEAQRTPANQPAPVCNDPNAGNDDPYRQSNGRRYRNGPSMDEVRNGRNFTEGDRGDGVRQLQQRMIEAGYNLGPRGADGFFGPQTARAAQEFFQRYRDLGGVFNQRAVERVNGAVEGIRSTRGGGIDAR